jgi:hypothetical protein
MVMGINEAVDRLKNFGETSRLISHILRLNELINTLGVVFVRDGEHDRYVLLLYGIGINEWIDMSDETRRDYCKTIPIFDLYYNKWIDYQDSSFILGE